MINSTESGFTLLEMVVVLVLLGIATSLVMPAVEKMHDASVRAIARNQIKTAINNLSLSARQMGTEIYLAQFPSSDNALPKDFVLLLESEDVKLELAVPLVISPLGFCVQNTNVLVVRGQLKYKLMVRSPDCRVVSDE